MIKQKNILVGIDGSLYALNALAYVSNNFNMQHLSINLVHFFPRAPAFFIDIGKPDCFKEITGSKYEEWLNRKRKQGKKFLSDARKLLGCSQDIGKSHRVILKESKQDIARSLIKEIHSGYSAVILGRRGKSRVEDLFLGSTCKKVIEAVKTVPICIVGKNVQSKKILVAVDFSENSIRAVRYVGEFAAGTDSEVTLYHVVHDAEPIMGDEGWNYWKTMEDKLELRVGQEIDKVFKRCGRILHGAGFDTSRIHEKCLIGSVGRARDIIKEATWGEYGTIIMGRKGVSNLKEFSLGRVTAKVLERAAGFAVWIVP